MESLSSDHEEVRILLRTMTKKIEESSAELTVPNYNVAIYGVMRMKVSYPEVQALFEVLMKKKKRDDF